MRASIAIVFLFIYFLALLNPIVPFLNYELNKEKIAAEFCENIAKPELNCQGKCHLMKQIEKQAKQEKESEKSANKIEIVAPVGKVEAIEVSELKQFFTKRLIPVVNQFYKNNRAIKIDYPPQWV